MDLIRSDGGSLRRKTVACLSAMTLGTAMLLTETASAQGRGDQAEAERLGVNFSKKLHNAGDAARTATRRADGTFLFDSGLVDFRPNREVVAGSQEKPFPPSVAQPGSVGDEDYSPLVLVDGIIYDAPVVAAAVDDAFINFPNGNPNY